MQYSLKPLEFLISQVKNALFHFQLGKILCLLDALHVLITYLYHRLITDGGSNMVRILSYKF